MPILFIRVGIFFEIGKMFGPMGPGSFGPMGTFFVTGPSVKSKDEAGNLAGSLGKTFKTRQSSKDRPVILSTEVSIL